MVMKARMAVLSRNNPAGIQLGHHVKPTKALKRGPANAKSVTEKKRREGVYRAKYLLTPSIYHSVDPVGNGADGLVAS